jgi:hypothetical protein
MPTADELIDLARACVDRLDLSDPDGAPTLEELEDAAGDEYEAMLDVLQEDEIFGGVDLDRQQELIETIEAKLPDASKRLVEELADQQTRQLWLLQQAAYHVGIAVGLKLSGRPGARDEE